MGFRVVPVSATTIESGDMSGTYTLSGTMASPNYAPGAAGWVINGDGSAEFNNVTARGEVDVTGAGGNTVRVYNDATNGAVVSMRPATTPATVAPAQTITQWIDTGNGPQPHITTTPPIYNNHGNAHLDIAGTNADGTSGTRAELLADNVFLTGLAAVTLGGGTANLQVTPSAVNVNSDMAVTGILQAPKCAGSVAVSFTSQTAWTQAVTFPEPFPNPPAVMVNINTGTAAAAHWDARAEAITTTGFTLFVFAPSGGTAQTWAGLPVQWLAVGM